MSLEHLPLPVKIHASTALVVGLGMTFFPQALTQNSFFQSLNRKLGLEASDPTPSGLSPNAEKYLTTAGVVTTAVGVMYLTTGHIPAERNQFLVASVPIRLSVGALSVASWIVNPNSRDIFKLAFIIEDIFGATALGYSLGRWWPEA